MDLPSYKMHLFQGIFKKSFNASVLPKNLTLINSVRERLVKQYEFFQKFLYFPNLFS